MDRYKKLFSIATLMMMMIGLTIVVSAQRRNTRGYIGSYGNTTYNRNLNSTIRNLRYKSRRFDNTLDRALDRSRYDGSRREDQLNKLAKRFNKAVKKLDKKYHNGRDSYRSRREAQRVLSLGSQLNRALSSSRIKRNSTIRYSWRSIQRDLQTIAREFNSDYSNNRGRRNNRNNGRYGRNSNRNRIGIFSRRSNRNLRSTIVNLKYKSRNLENRLDRERKYSRYGRRYFNNLENMSDRFNDAVKDLEKKYDSDRDFNRSYNKVRRVLSLGSQLDRAISRARANRSIRREWNSIERDLRTIARAYNLRYS